MTDRRTVRALFWVIVVTSVLTNLMRDAYHVERGDYFAFVAIALLMLLVGLLVWVLATVGHDRSR